MDALKLAERESHWQHIYATRDATRVGWFAPRLNRSIELIKQYAQHPSAPVIDVGGGASTLVDDLLIAGYQNVSVLDISEKALQISQQRLGAVASRVCWQQGDIMTVHLPQKKYAVWHDRAVFHFFLDKEAKEAYVRQLSHALQPGAHVIIATFGPDGPTVCSDLPTNRYTAAQLSEALGAAFALQMDTLEMHTTPFSTVQQFLYACFKYIG